VRLQGGGYTYFMAIRIVRLGTPRSRGEGLRLGTVRRPPRGVRKEDYARRDYFDLWFPELAPSAKLVKWFFDKPVSEARWAKYVKSYRREMGRPAERRLLQLLAQLSRGAQLSVGCYCEREGRCHRSILRELLAEQGAQIAEG
jgi:uncharacterized protein YeaO (DUF488 family)